MLDNIDKEILRLLIKYEHKALTIYQIAKKIGRAPLTIKRHVLELEEEGYVYMKEDGKVRQYDRKN